MNNYWRNRPKWSRLRVGLQWSRLEILKTCVQNQTVFTKWIPSILVCIRVSCLCRICQLWFIWYLLYRLSTIICTGTGKCSWQFRFTHVHASWHIYESLSGCTWCVSFRGQLNRSKVQWIQGSKDSRVNRSTTPKTSQLSWSKGW